MNIPRSDFSDRRFVLARKDGKCFPHSYHRKRHYRSMKEALEYKRYLMKIDPEGFERGIYVIRDKKEYEDE